MQPYVLVARCWYATDHWWTVNSGNRLFTTVQQIINKLVAVLQSLFPLPYDLVLTYHNVVYVLRLFLLWLTFFSSFWTPVVNFLPAIMGYTVSERAWWNFKTYDNRKVWGGQEFAKFQCEINVVRIGNIVNNLGFWVIFLETREWQGTTGYCMIPVVYKWLTWHFYYDKFTSGLYVMNN